MNLQVTRNDPYSSIKAIHNACSQGPRYDGAAERARIIAGIYRREREEILPVLNGAATNSIDANLKRVLILQETIRDFAVRVLPLRLFATSFLDTPLEGTDQVSVRYYPLQTAASSSLDSTQVPAYVFGQATTTNKALITVNNRKYQPLDYSSQEFRRQPFFDAARLGKLNAERLAVDVFNDIMSVVTAANFGAASKTIPANAVSSDDVVDLKSVADTAMWPDSGRSLIVDSSVDTALQKDSSYKLALNIGTTSVIQRGEFPKLSNFDYAWMPNLPSNGENLIGFIAFASAILAAFAPVAPAPGVRQQLVAYEIATDEATGISFNYRHWGVAMDDRDYEIIECAYGYAKGVPAALKRIVHP